MSRLWLRSEVFDGVLPLRSSGVPLSPARAMGPGGGAPSPLFVLLKALREANPDTVRWVWVRAGLGLVGLASVSMLVLLLFGLWAGVGLLWFDYGLVRFG